MHRYINRNVCVNIKKTLTKQGHHKTIKQDKDESPLIYANVVDVSDICINIESWDVQGRADRVTICKRSQNATITRQPRQDKTKPHLIYAKVADLSDAYMNTETWNEQRTGKSKQPYSMQKKTAYRKCV